MKKTLQHTLIALLCVSMAFITACSDKDPIIVDDPVQPSTGLYVLNEGAFQTSGSSSISYIDLETKEVTKNIFQTNNPTASLGSAPADMDQYGSQLFVTVTGSDKVVVIDAETAKQVKVIDVDQPRYMAFYGGKVFVTSYTNNVVVIDTLTNTEVAKIPVGRTPEQIVVANNKLYVAHSGSNDYFGGGAYDNRVFVIDPIQLSVQKEIEVADNLFFLYSDGKGYVYAGTQDIFNSTWDQVVLPSKLYRLNSSADAVDKEFDFGGLQMAFSNNAAYVVSTNYQNENGVYNLLEMDLNGDNIRKINHFNSLTIDNIYALGVNSENGDIWISNSDYINDGQVYHYSTATQNVEDFSVGLNPSVLLFKK